MALADADRPVAAQVLSSRRRLLFLHDTKETLRQQRQMGQTFEATGNWQALYMQPADPRLALEAGDEPAGSASSGASIPAAPRSRGRMALLPAWMHQPTFGIHYGLRLRRRRAFARRRLQALAPACIITAQERSEDFLPVVAAAQDLGIPVVLLVSAGIYMPDGGAYMRRNQPDTMLDCEPDAPGYRRDVALLNRLVGWLLPKQVFRSRWGRILHRPAGWYLAMGVAGLHLPNAWFQGTRFIDAIVVSGEDEIRVCDVAGVPAHKVFNLGNPVLQRCYEQRSQRSAVRANLAAHLPLDPAKPWLVFSAPPIWEHNLIGRDQHMADLRAVLASLRDVRCELIVSLHPKMAPENYEAMLAEAGAKLARLPLAEYLAGADIFVGGGYSSTVRWALAIGIPTANVDIWDLKESTYFGLKDYPTLWSIGELTQWRAETLDRLLAGWRPALDRLPLGMLCDGKFDARLIALVDEMVRR